jgi:hypothetical protein
VVVERSSLLSSQVLRKERCEIDKEGGSDDLRRESSTGGRSIAERQKSPK